MKAKFQISSFLFYGLTALMLILSIISFAGAVSWLNKPFPGFLMYRDPLVSNFGSREWPGPQAGLRFLDRIVSMDNQPVHTGGQVIKAARQKGPGTPVSYVVESKGTIREVTVPVAVFGFTDFFMVFFTIFLCGFSIYVLGVIVYLFKPNTSSSWVFLGLCSSLGTYIVTGFEVQSTHLLNHFNTLGMCFFAATFFHLGLIFPDRKRIISRFPVLEYIIYAPAIVLALLYQIYYSFPPDAFTSNALSWMPSYLQLSSTSRLYVMFSAASLLVLVFHARFKATTIMARQRARMIVFGVGIAFLPTSLFMAAVHFLKVNIPWNFLIFFVLFFPASIGYSIVRHNLFDADTIIRRTVGYFVVTAVVIGIYALVSISFNVFMGQYQLAQSKAFPILFTLGVILVFNPLRDRIQALVDRIFFRKEYDYGDIVEKVGGAMTSLLDLPQILKRLTQTFIEDMFISTSSVMLLTPDGQQYQVSLADGEKRQEVENKTFKRDDPIFGIIEAEKRELTKYDVIEDPKYKDVSAGSAANFEELHASLMVPLVFQDQVIGSLNFGEKKSGKPFNREDLDLLRTLAHQGAVAIENARLFQENLEKQRMEEELNIARDLQMSMLPAECPKVEGLDIAAYCVSAQEVGGDFYDFIEMGEKKAGFVIGDVTGKSVSGALVMSASRSVLRMLSEEEIGVSESMMRANRRLKKDIKSGMFVALLFAVLNSEKKTLTLCSAGQTQPIHRAAKTEEAILVDTEGDAFPLGILEEANYEETILQLEAGDKVVFYTDGIVEAMNEKEEMYGFERLQDVVHKAKSMDAESLLKEILNQVNEFAGAAAQHDDITVIVVGVAE